MIYLITLSVVVLVGVGTLLWAVRVAPRGYEDEFGFHGSEEPKGLRASPPRAAKSRAKRKSRAGLAS